MLDQGMGAKLQKKERPKNIVYYHKLNLTTLPFLLGFSTDLV